LQPIRWDAPGKTSAGAKGWSWYSKSHVHMTDQDGLGLLYKVGKDELWAGEEVV